MFTRIFLVTLCILSLIHPIKALASIDKLDVDEKKITSDIFPNQETISINNALNAYSMNLQLSLKKAQETNTSLRSLIKSTRAIVLQEEKLFYKLETLLQVIHSNSILMIEFIGQINGLKKAIENTIQPLLTTQEYLLAQKNEAKNLKKAFTVSIKNPNEIATKQIIEKNTVLIQELEAILTDSQAQLNTILPKSAILIEKINKTIETTRLLIPEKIKEKYALQFKPVIFSLSSWKNLIHDLALWKASMEFRLIIAIPTTKNEILTATQRFIFTLVLSFIPLSYFFIKSKKIYTPKERYHLFPFVLLLFMGFALYVSSFHSRGLIYSWILYIAISIILISLLSIGWFFKQKKLHAKKLYSSPMLLPTLYALIGNICMLIVLPPLLTKLIWVGMLSLALATYKKRIEVISSTKLSIFIHYMVFPLLLLAFCLSTEWSILIFTTLVIFSVLLQISSTASWYLTLATEKKFPTLAKPLKILLEGFFTLASYFIGSLSLFLWFYIVPEGSILLNKALTNDTIFMGVSLRLLNIITLFIVFYLCKTMVKALQESLLFLNKPFPNLSKDIMQPLQTTITYTAWTIFIFSALSLLGIDLKSLTIILGGLSVGIGFGLQTIFNNFFSGLILIFGRIVREGDILELADGTFGVVKKVNMRATIVESYTNAIVFIPNSDLASKQFTNWTRNDSEMRREISIPVPYGADVEFVKELLISTTKDHAYIKDDPAPSIVFNDFAASNLDFRLRFWVTEISKGVSTTSEIREAITKAFAEHNIVMPFQQIDISIKKD